ncbi:ArnT family glycosyltransferase [Winogradskyella sp. A3E31]|uniref:ArnT family glycosyltransferase n=1 Tax=Winogradskyella sp. A3E31 TaxID=3349637 RepID=UPI00398B0449
MIKTIQKYPIASLMCFALLMLGFSIWAVPVSIMEARNFISAREMLTDNNWILTTMNGEPRYEKPPLPTWITAFFGLVFGIKNVLALRIPAILCIGIIGVYSYLISKALKLPHNHSLRNGFIVMTSFYVIGIIIEAPWDIYAHGFMIMAIYYLLKQLQYKTSVLYGILFALCISASVLSKGPVSLYALCLPFLMSYGIVFKYNGGLLKNLKLLTLFVFGIAIGGLWYLYVRIADPITFTEIATKETGNWSSYNVRPFYYYWSFFTQSGLWTIPAFISLLYPYMKSKVSNLKIYKFTLFWTLLAVVLLSVIPEKKSRYLMPVLIPLALNIGFYIEYLIQHFKTLSSKKDTYPVYFNFGLIGTIGIMFPIAVFIFIGDFSGVQWVLFSLASILLVSIGLLIFKNMLRKHMKNVVYLCFGLMLVLGVFALPLISTQQHDGFKPISELRTENLPAYSLGSISPEAVWNYGDKVPSLNSEEGFTIPNETSFYLITEFNKPLGDSSLSDLYTIKSIGTYDLNFAAQDQRGYKNRLKNDVYLLSRK